MKAGERTHPSPTQGMLKKTKVAEITAFLANLGWWERRASAQEQRVVGANQGPAFITEVRGISSHSLWGVEATFSSWVLLGMPPSNSTYRNTKRSEGGSSQGSRARTLSPDTIRGHKWFPEP